MTKLYYFKNLLLAALLTAIFIFAWSSGGGSPTVETIAFFSIINMFLFPFSRLLLESLALTFTHKEFWKRGLFKETAAKSGLYAMYYLVCFTFAILFSAIYLIYSLIKRFSHAG
ncbi:colicin E1 family microcin immunity protein [Dryocola clanedunensis]